MLSSDNHIEIIYNLLFLLAKIKKKILAPIYFFSDQNDRPTIKKIIYFYLVYIIN